MSEYTPPTFHVPLTLDTTRDPESAAAVVIAHVLDGDGLRLSTDAACRVLGFLQERYRARQQEEFEMARDARERAQQ